MYLNYVSCLVNRSCRSFIVKRGLKQTTKPLVSNESNEVEFNVPWGKIRGKLWGSKDKQPILTLHGWMDNCGSFDLLAPLLKNSSILAIDLAGHGLSSWLPNGIPYNEDITILTLRMISNHYGWKKIKLMGHSMGGIICNLYAQHFPEEIEFIVSLDALSHFALDIKTYINIRSKFVDRYLKIKQKNLKSQPSYPKNIAKERWMNASSSSDLDSSATEILMIRGAKEEANGEYSFTRDYCLNCKFIPFFTTEASIEINQVITCPYLVLKASKTPFAKESYWSDIKKTLSKSSRDFRFKVLNGCHHMHMMQPQMVANEINPFLSKYDN